MWLLRKKKKKERGVFFLSLLSWTISEKTQSAIINIYLFSLFLSTIFCNTMQWLQPLYTLVMRNICREMPNDFVQKKKRRWLFHMGNPCLHTVNYKPKNFKKCFSWRGCFPAGKLLLIPSAPEATFFFLRV